MAMVYHGYQPWLHGVPMVTPVRALHLGYTTHQTSGEGVQLTSLSVYLHLVFVFAKIPDPPSGEGLQLVSCVCTSLAFVFVQKWLDLHLLGT